ncbi:GP158 protein, partial [Cisticola juncidis]|nr:GP158 protein [Cisticola juncidis]
RIRTSGIILLETILFGSLLLYFPVFILYFKPSIFRCIVLRWVRMLGFAIVYGTITLKLYRTPTAGRVWVSRLPQGEGTPTAERVLASGPSQWGGLGVWDLGKGLDTQDPKSGEGLGPSQWGGLGCSGSLSLLCPTAEVLLLLWGSFLCYATRAVPSAFHEPRYLGIALHNELMVSAAFHVVRVWVPREGGGCGVWRDRPPRVTVPAVPAVPAQFLHTGSPLREEITAEVYEDELDMRRSGSCMNSSIASAWSEHSLDPDDIR